MRVQARYRAGTVGSRAGRLRSAVAPFTPVRQLAIQEDPLGQMLIEMPPGGTIFGSFLRRLSRIR